MGGVVQAPPSLWARTVSLLPESPGAARRHAVSAPTWTGGPQRPAAGRGSTSTGRVSDERPGNGDSSLPEGALLPRRLLRRGRLPVAPVRRRRGHRLRNGAARAPRVPELALLAAGEPDGHRADPGRARAIPAAAGHHHRAVHDRLHVGVHPHRGQEAAAHARALHAAGLVSRLPEGKRTRNPDPGCDLRVLALHGFDQRRGPGKTCARGNERAGVSAGRDRGVSRGWFLRGADVPRVRPSETERGHRPRRGDHRVVSALRPHARGQPGRRRVRHLQHDHHRGHPVGALLQDRVALDAGRLPLRVELLPGIRLLAPGERPPDLRRP